MAYRPLSRSQPKRVASGARHGTSPTAADGALSPATKLSQPLSNHGLLLQAKLRIGAPGDRYEREGERMAEQVMRIPEPAFEQGLAEGSAGEETVQRACCTECSEGRTCAASKEEEILQAQPLPDCAPALPEGWANRFAALRGGGQPLPASLRRFFEPRFGCDFSAVRIHADGPAATAAREVQARAFTVGRDIVFAAGHYAPQTTSGQRLLAHELTHVVQQGAAAEGGGARMRIGRVQRVRLQRDADIRFAPPGLGSRCTLVVGPGHLPGLDFEFTVGSATLTPTQVRDIVAFARGWTPGGGFVFVDGFASTDGRQRRNWELSCQRAEVVRDVLVDNGVPAGDILTSAHGESVEFSRTLLPPNRRAVLSTQRRSPPTPEPPRRTDNPPAEQPHATIYMCAKDLDESPFGRHAFFRIGGSGAGNPTISLEPFDRSLGADCWQGVPGRSYPSDVYADADCEIIPITLTCLEREFRAYPVGHYCTLGPNSNTFVGHIARNCGVSDPDPPGWTPGIDDSPPPSGTFAPDKWTTLLQGCTTKICIFGRERRPDEPVVA